MTAIMEPPVSLEGMSEEEKDRLLAALMAERAEPEKPEPVREGGIGPYPRTGAVVVYKGSVGTGLGDAGTMGSSGLAGRWLGGF